MSDLSVFVDESGDTGPNSRRYIVALVLHDQSLPVDGEVARLRGQLRDLGLPDGEPVHAGPLIRREEAFSGMDIGRRRRLLGCMAAFLRRSGVSCATFPYLKRELGAGGPGGVEGRLRARLARDLKLFISERSARFASFDRVIVYYDGGQRVVASALREAFGEAVSRVEFRRVVPSDYRLFQAADLVCTLELLRLKADARELSRGELAFFGSAAKLRKNYLRQLDRLRLP